ncbi:hypothetical protein DFH28DRAFT_975164 [Melampsora americana]|nr:hypothetical protein DFH28DRAFT_975164 [Melampsora americana]
MLALLKFIAICGALFFYASSQNTFLHSCLPPLPGAPARVDPKQCQIALGKFTQQNGFFVASSGTVRDCGGCKVELFSPLGEDIRNPVGTVSQAFQFILSRCDGGIGRAWLNEFDKNVPTAKILIDSSNSMTC